MNSDQVLLDAIAAARKAEAQFSADSENLRNKAREVTTREQQVIAKEKELLAREDAIKAREDKVSNVENVLREGARIEQARNELANEQLRWNKQVKDKEYELNLREATIQRREDEMAKREENVNKKEKNYKAEIESIFKQKVADFLNNKQ